MTLGIGVNVQINQRKVEYDPQLVSSRIPSITAIGDANDLQWAWQLQKDTGCIVIFRPTPFEIGPESGAYGKGDASVEGKAWVTQLVNFLGADRQKYSNFYWQCGWDEKKGNWEWNAAYSIAALREAAKYGLKLCVINLYWGNPPDPFWDGFEGWDALWPAVEEAVKHNAYIGLHAYIDPHAPVSVQGQAHALTRPRHLVELARSRGLKVRVAITETGLTTIYSDANIASLEVYGKSLSMAAKLYSDMPEVEVFNVYTLDKLDGLLLNGKYHSGEFPADREVFTEIKKHNANLGATLPPPTPTPPPPIKKWGIVKTVALNVRRGPGFDYEVIGSISRETNFDVATTNPPVGKPDNWVEVRLEAGLAGWCYAPLIKKY